MVKVYNQNMPYVDAHFHLIPCVEQCGKNSVLVFYGTENYAITCAHSPQEFEKQDLFIHENGLSKNIVQSFGIHPQLPLVAYADNLEMLLKEKRITCIGETGFDFYTEEYKSKKAEQLESFHACLDLAVKHSVPLVIHDRKALDILFSHIGLLKKVPSVLFHSFAFSSTEARSILTHGVNAYFSFSKQILNGNKKSLSCLEDLPLDRLFMETDAPYQTLKGESHTLPSEIIRVYEEGARIKKMSLDSFCQETRDNFRCLFGL